MALKRVKYLFIDDEGRLIADLEGGARSIVGLTRSEAGQPGGVASLNNQGKIPVPQFPNDVATQGDVQQVRVMMTRAALRLLATQNNDGGWEWMNPDTNPSQGVPSPANTLGVTCQGLLDCYRVGSSARCLTACRAVYDSMVTYSEDPDPSKHRIRGPDITYLVELSEVTMTRSYADFAKTRWVSARAEFGGGTATGLAQWIRDTRIAQSLPAIISWDINLYVQGLLALERYFPGEGFGSQANEMVEVIYDSLYVPPVDFDITDDTLNEFWNGISGALDAFLSTETHPTQSGALASQLVGGQEDDGHFPGIVDGSDIQTTAYAVLALIKAEKDRAVLSSINYLVGSQLNNGGWLYDGGENTEVTSEVIQAVYHFTF